MMKLKAPPDVGDPCVAGVAIHARDGIYDVEAEIGALLIECFGFAIVSPQEKAKIPPAPLPKLSLPAWRTKPAAKMP